MLIIPPNLNYDHGLFSYKRTVTAPVVDAVQSKAIIAGARVAIRVGGTQQADLSTSVGLARIST